MKKIIFSLFALLLTLGFVQNAAAQNAPAKRANWQEMHDFHEVMSITFHSAEEQNFAPLKEKSGLLIERAKTWQKSAVPAGYKVEVTHEVLKRLVKQCKKVDKLVKKDSSDAELFTGINTAHEIFHEIMEKCRE